MKEVCGEEGERRKGHMGGGSEMRGGSVGGSELEWRDGGNEMGQRGRAKNWGDHWRTTLGLGG
jgi:hypothetical protein